MDKTTIKSGDCFVEAEVNDEGWIIISDDDGNRISLGYYPNKRCNVIESALKLSDNIRKRREIKRKGTKK